MDAEGTELKGGFDAANKLYDEESQYFKPELNIGYELGFSKWRLMRKMVPNFNDKTRLEEKTVLELVVDWKDGAPTKIHREWGILSKIIINAFEPYCRNGNITKKIYSVKIKQVGGKNQPQISEVREKPTGGAQAPPQTKILPMNNLQTETDIKDAKDRTPKHEEHYEQ